MKELNYNEVLKKIEEMKKGRNFDLSTEEDLAIAVMNLISLEEHMFFTGAKTDKPEYFEMLNEIRGMRTKLLGKMIDKTEGETWCISKHLLATCMRLFEVGTKLQSDGKKAEAIETFEQAHKMFTMFFALRLKIVEVCDIKDMANEEKPWTMKDIVNKLVDCCKE
ncbi:MAG: hypothetical protein WC631_02015 [Candidatus Paceibacterota bacterium]|jgi:hypothetical protein